MNNDLYLMTMTMENAAQVQAFINYIELMQARLHNMMEETFPGTIEQE